MQLFPIFMPSISTIQICTQSGNLAPKSERCQRLLRQPSCNSALPAPVAGGKKATKAERGRRLIELKHSIRVSSNERQLKMHHKRPQCHFINVALIYALNSEEQRHGRLLRGNKAKRREAAEPVPEPEHWNHSFGPEPGPGHGWMRVSLAASAHAALPLTR